MPFKTALITGASSGIGKEFALALAKQRQWNLILVARRLDALQHVKDSICQLWNASAAQESPTVEIKNVDLVSETNRNDMLNRIQQAGKSIDLLINNAGFVRVECFDTGNLEQSFQMIELHCAAPLHLCRAVLPGMVANRSGIIINVCSRQALAPLPFLACYAATKTFLLFFSMALAQEVKGKGVKILALCPGSIDTESHRSRHASYKRHLLGIMTPERLVSAALQAIQGNSSFCVVGIRNRIFFGLLRIMPMAISARIQGVRMKCYLRTFTNNRKLE